MKCPASKPPSAQNIAPDKEGGAIRVEDFILAAWEAEHVEADAHIHENGPVVRFIDGAG
jgi:hypothetical protein